MSSYYAILEGRKVREVTFKDWSSWYLKNSNKSHVDRTEIDGVIISTVFLAINHSFGQVTPLWFETMIFGGELDGYQKRYETYEEAEEGHQKCLQKVLQLDR